MKQAWTSSIVGVLLVACGGRTSGYGPPDAERPDAQPPVLQPEPAQGCVQLESGRPVSHWTPAGGGPEIVEMRPQAVRGAGERALNDVWVRSPDDVYAAGDGILHWDGCSWSVVREGWYETIWSNSDRVWFGGARSKCEGDCVGLVTELAGGVWTELPELGGRVTSVWAAAPDNVWVVTLEPPPNDPAIPPLPVIQRWDGGGWQLQTRSGFDGGHVLVGRDAALYIGSVAGLQASSGELLVNGRCGNSRGRVGDTLYAGYCRIDASGKIDEIGLPVRWGSSEQDVWGVSSGGSVLRSNGVDSWEVDRGTEQPLRAVMGSRERDVWAVGSSGTLLHFAP